MDDQDDQYPRGKLRDDDQGVARLRIGVHNNTVVIAFPVPVAWFGMGAHEARGLAELLLKHAAMLES